MTTIILGGGIIGTTTAYYLAKAGEKVVVLERRSDVALETSFANAGLVAPGHSYAWASPQAPWILLKSLVSKGQSLRFKFVPDWRMYAWCWEFLKNCTHQRALLNTGRKVRLAIYSQSQLAALKAAEGLDFEGGGKGLLYLHRHQTSLDRAAAASSVLTDAGLELRVLDRAQTIQLEPALRSCREHLAGAMFCPTDETGDARLFTKALHERCVGLGVEFLFDTTVNGFQSSADAVQSVETSRGRLTAERFVLALGSYSPGVARRLGYRLPIYPVKGYSVTVPTSPDHDTPRLGGIDEHSLIAWAPFRDRLRITATAEFAGYNTNHSAADLRYMLETARRLFPNGADYSKPSVWAGLRPMTPGGTPIIGATRHSNLFLNVGHGHLGWTWACGTAKIVCDVMQGKAADIDTTGLALT